MKMGKLSVSLLLVLLVCISVRNMVPKADGCSYLEVTGGGCPNQSACYETCRPCYVGVGMVETYCVPPGGGINWWRCRCVFKNGAPCPPHGPPGCPKPPAIAPNV